MAFSVLSAQDENASKVTTNVSSLCPLADTIVEIKCVARSFGASSQEIFLGQNFTKKWIKSVTLSDYRVIHFASHGLSAADSHHFGGPSEQSIVTTPSAATGSEENGLLPASELAALKLEHFPI